MKTNYKSTMMAKFLPNGLKIAFLPAFLLTVFSSVPAQSLVSATETTIHAETLIEQGAKLHNAGNYSQAVELSARRAVGDKIFRRD